MTQVMVEAKNRTGTNIQACVVTGHTQECRQDPRAVNDVPAGVTRTAQLMSTDDIKGYDTVKLEASTYF